MIQKNNIEPKWFYIIFISNLSPCPAPFARLSAMVQFQTADERMGWLDCVGTPLVGLVWSVSDIGLTRLWFADKPPPVNHDHDVLVKDIRSQLTAYLGGTLKIFDIPLAPLGTPFQRRSWEALQKIGYGQTISYADQAKIINHPSATRAVANANGANPIPIIIPCHRVIASDRGLGGYGPGVDKKRWLLMHERKYA